MQYNQYLMSRSYISIEIVAVPPRKEMLKRANYEEHLMIGTFRQYSQQDRSSCSKRQVHTSSRTNPSFWTCILFPIRNRSSDPRLLVFPAIQSCDPNGNLDHPRQWCPTRRTSTLSSTSILDRQEDFSNPPNRSIPSQFPKEHSSVPSISWLQCVASIHWLVAAGTRKNLMADDLWKV